MRSVPLSGAFKSPYLTRSSIIICVRQCSEKRVTCDGKITLFWRPISPIRISSFAIMCLQKERLVVDSESSFLINLALSTNSFATMSFPMSMSSLESIFLIAFHEQRNCFRFQKRKSGRPCKTTCMPHPYFDWSWLAVLLVVRHGSVEGLGEVSWSFFKGF